MRIVETVCSAMSLFSPLKMKQVRRVLPRVSPHWVRRYQSLLLPYSHLKSYLSYISIGKKLSISTTPTIFPSQILSLISSSSLFMHLGGRWFLCLPNLRGACFYK